MPGSSRSLPAALLLVTFLVRSVAAQGEGERPPGAAAAREALPCLERPIVVAYLHQLQDRMMDHWVVPADTLANQTVVVRFRLSAEGSLVSYQLVSWTNRRIANSVELAVARSGPFGSIPEGASCLVGRSIDMRFENPG